MLRLSLKLDQCKALAVGSAKSHVESALENHQRAQKRLKEARAELERVIFEHDEAVLEHKSEEIIRVTISVIHDMVGRCRLNPRVEPGLIAPGFSS